MSQRFAVWLLDAAEVVQSAAIRGADRFAKVGNGEAQNATIQQLADFIRNQIKPQPWVAGAAVVSGQIVSTALGTKWWIANTAISAANNTVSPVGGAQWTEISGGGGNSNSGGSATILSGAIDPTADSPANAPLGAAYVNTVDLSLWFKVAAADPNAWVEISGAAGLARGQVLALLKEADAAATENERGTMSLATVRSTISAGLAVANSTLRAAALKVFTDYLPVPSGGMGLRWKADGSGLENYEITTDFVLRVVRFVRVAHDAAAPTLTGGVPGDSWRGGAFATPPVAGNGGVLLGSWPANPDFATYDFYQFSAEVDTASAAAIMWANNGKRDNANPPDLTGGLSQQEVLDLLATEAAAATEVRRGTMTLAAARALNANVTIDAVGGRSGLARLPDEVMPGSISLRGFSVAEVLAAAGNVEATVSNDAMIAPQQMVPVAFSSLPEAEPVTGNFFQVGSVHPVFKLWRDGDVLKFDTATAGGNADSNAVLASLTFQVSRSVAMNQALKAAAEAKAAADAAQTAAETAQETADGKAPKTTYEFQIAPAPQAPSAPADNIFIPFTDPIAPQGPLDERVPVTFTFRRADGDVEVETSAYTLRASSEAAPVVLADPEDDTKEFAIWYISETSLGWNYRNADDSAIANHGILFVQVSFISRRTLDATNIPPDLDRGASDNGSLVNTKLLKRVLATFPSVGQLGQQISDIMSLIKILKRDGVSQFLSHLALGADTVSVAPGFARLADLRDLTMSVAASAMNYIQAGSGVVWNATTKILSGLGAADGHLFGLHIKAIQAGTVMQLRKADGSLMNLITMKADGSIHFNSYHDEAFEDDEHTIHVATDWSPTDFSGSTFAEVELPVIGDHWPGSETAGSTDYNGATFSPFIVRLLERGVVAQGARVQLPALDPTQQAAIHFEAEAVWVDTDVRLVSAGAEAVVQYRYARRTTPPEVFARVYVQIRLHVIRGSVTGRVDDLHLNSTVNYTTHTHVAAGVTEAPALLTAAADSEFVFYSAAPLPAAPRAPTIAVYVNPQGGESSFNDFYPERGSFDYDQVVLNDDIVSEIRHAAHTQYISHAELYAYARLRTSKWVYAIGRLVVGTARVMLTGIGMGFSEGAEGEGGKAFLVEGEGGGDSSESVAAKPDAQKVLFTAANADAAITVATNQALSEAVPLDNDWDSFIADVDDSDEAANGRVALLLAVMPDVRQNWHPIAGLAHGNTHGYTVGDRILEFGGTGNTGISGRLEGTADSIKRFNVTFNSSGRLWELRMTRGKSAAVVPAWTTIYDGSANRTADTSGDILGGGATVYFTGDLSPYKDLRFTIAEEGFSQDNSIGASLEISVADMKTVLQVGVQYIHGNSTGFQAIISVRYRLNGDDDELYAHSVSSVGSGTTPKIYKVEAR